MRAAIAFATADFPDAVGPKIPRTLPGRCGGKRLPPRAGALALHRAVLLRVGGAVLREPRDRVRNPLVQRRLRRPAEQLARLADVGDVARDLAEPRRRGLDLRL